MIGLDQHFQAFYSGVLCVQPFLWLSRSHSRDLQVSIFPFVFLQTLVEYGANVTMQNHVGEKPSQSAERHGHTMCSRYLVVVETCLSLASQVVKLTKQLKE